MHETTIASIFIQLRVIWHNLYIIKSLIPLQDALTLYSWLVTIILKHRSLLDFPSKRIYKSKAVMYKTQLTIKQLIKMKHLSVEFFSQFLLQNKV